MKKIPKGCSQFDEKESQKLHSMKQAVHLLSSEPEKAFEIISGLLVEEPNDHLLLVIASRAQKQLGNYSESLRYIDKSLDVQSDNADALYIKAELLYLNKDVQIALSTVKNALALKPTRVDYLSLQSRILQSMNKYDDAEDVLTNLLQAEPESYIHWCNLGLLKMNTGYLTEADEFLKKGEEFSTDKPAAFFNRIVNAHYSPEKTAEQILGLCKAWQSKFKPNSKLAQPEVRDIVSNRKIRIGMISDGFRVHPVGNMITQGLMHIPSEQIEFVAYSTNNEEDLITTRIQGICVEWRMVAELSDEELANTIIQDKIDILFDLCGYNSNSRMRTMMMKPAAIQIKWVGGLISSTGVDVIDYLLSDSIETPPSIDSLYTEKLIRLPDDYICYDPPNYLPPISKLPAKKNEYITFGCFNNAAKVNDILLLEWSKILNSVPNSRLFLKSFQYASERLRERIYSVLEINGISRERVRIESSSPHRELLASYNDVDIALDPWPYSGGLTTCEAMAMGVPVVTLPGPTFAGRHSASHLVNAGMPELVADSWEHYINIAVGMANDLDSLSIIRQHLRDILLASPVCDGKRFAKNFSDAMRAVWQRHCEGKTPEALTLSNDALPYFHDDNLPVTLLHPIVESMPSTKQQAGFSFQLSGKVIVMDNGGSLAMHKNFINLSATDAFHFVIMDMVGEIEERHLPLRKKGIQHIKLHGLGDGESVPVYMCLAPEYCSNLVPLSSEGGSKVLAEVMAQTSKLDHIHGLNHLDWLILDNRYDIRKAIIHGKRILSDCLVVQVKITFSQTHQEQLLLSDVTSLLTQYGFSFHSLEDIEYAKPIVIDEQNTLPSSKMVSAVAVYLPDNTRIQAMEIEQREKLAFILHTAYRMYDDVFSILKIDSKERAESYLIELNIKNNIEDYFSVDSSFLKEQSVPSGFVMGLDEPYPPLNSEIPCHTKTSSRIRVVDIGANPIDGEPPYKKLLISGNVDLIGFEPQPDALKQLNMNKGIHEQYLPYAVGTGEEITLYLCRASGMTSTLRPNFTILNHFQGYPVWAEILREERLRTVKLDDIDEIKGIDWLKIDIQGGELNVFLNAEEKLKDTLVIQTEVNFIQLYEEQPLFAEIDQWMRAHGFMLHTLLEERRRLYAPYVLNNQIHQGLNQLTTADAVYIRDINKLDDLMPEQLNKMAIILRESYGSFDLAEKIMVANNDRQGK
ncbi:FkbM family methyltransferase [Pectobacterium brasiliense]|uniref:FkbM family methyltransferase n=1 Tax=Pectobacterium brasiliense TaxID=180957 RepID=UPI00201C868D|nr:FkbM family methyltransferase [Pectobacterium brasiliense]MCL6377677.1 FkbM family methyltransferase [Pectobacterium brasiliense]